MARFSFIKFPAIFPNGQLRCLILPCLFPFFSPLFLLVRKPQIPPADIHLRARVDGDNFLLSAQVFFLGIFRWTDGLSVASLPILVVFIFRMEYPRPAVSASSSPPTEFSFSSFFSCPSPMRAASSLVLARRHEPGRVSLRFFLPSVSSSLSPLDR